MKKIILTTALIVMGSPAFANININHSNNVQITGTQTSNNININQSRHVTIGGGNTTNQITTGNNQNGHQHVLQGNNNTYTNNGTYNNQTYNTNNYNQDFSTTNNSTTNATNTTNNVSNTTVIQSMGNWNEIQESQERMEEYSMMSAAPASLPFQDKGISVGLGMMQGGAKPVPVLGLQTTHGSVRSRIIATTDTVTAGVTFTF